MGSARFSPSVRVRKPKNNHTQLEAVSVCVCVCVRLFACVFFSLSGSFAPFPTASYVYAAASKPPDGQCAYAVCFPSPGTAPRVMLYASLSCLLLFYLVRPRRPVQQRVSVCVCRVHIVYHLSLLIFPFRFRRSIWSNFPFRLSILSSSIGHTDKPPPGARKPFKRLPVSSQPKPALLACLFAVVSSVVHFVKNVIFVVVSVEAEEPTAVYFAIQSRL